MGNIDEEALALLMKELDDESEAEISCDKLNFLTDDDFKIMDQHFNPDSKIDYIEATLNILYKLMPKNLSATDADTYENSISQIQKIEEEMREVAKNINSKSMKIVPELTKILKKYNSEPKEIK